VCPAPAAGLGPAQECAKAALVADTLLASTSSSSNSSPASAAYLEIAICGHGPKLSTVPQWNEPDRFVPQSASGGGTTFLPLPSHCLGHSINKTYTKVAEARPGLRQANEWRLRAGSGRIPRDRVAHVCREWSASRWGPSAHPTTQDASGEVGPDCVTKPFWLSWAPGGARA